MALSTAKFEEVAAITAPRSQQAPKGHRTGRQRMLYIEDPIWNELRDRCAAKGISVSRYLQTLAALSLR